MGKRLKRGKKGNAAQYLTRNQAIKKLQLRLSEFRRLCILKGIHPREPKKKVQGANKTYYHVKDINWLAHEPLIHTFRSLKAHDRKVRKAAAKHNLDLARRLARHKPGYRLDHLVKERYPSFVDALRDLDDALTLVHLFAHLPASAAHHIPGPALTRCKRLVLEWQAYCARTSGLRRVFISVKGWYYQAEVAGQAVTWLVPHAVSQVLPPDVDYRIMATFLEFYTTLLQFVLFKLYHGLGLRYPPVLDQQLEQAAAALAGIMRDIAGLAAAEAEQQEAAGSAAAADNNSSGGDAAAAAAAAAQAGEADVTPDVVRRLTSLGDKIKQIQAQAGGQQQQQQNGSAAANGDHPKEGGSESDEGADLDIDSGGSDSEPDSEAGDEEEGSGSEEGSEGEEEEGSSSEEEQEASGSEQGAEEEEEAGALQLSAEARSAGEPSTSGGLPAGYDGAAAAGGSLGVVAGDDEGELCGAVLRGCVVYLAREVPREPLLFIVRAFGGVAAWEGEGSPHAEGDEAITHQVVDRPTQGHKFLSRAYVQPQWVVDSANARLLLPVDLYAPGRPPPPHLSPFVDYDKEGYMPDWARTVQQLQEAAQKARQRAVGALTEAQFLATGEDGAADGAAAAAAAAAGQSEEAAAAAAERTYQAELAKELRGRTGGAEDDPDASDEENHQQQQQQQQQGPGEEELMADIMMSRKNRKLYQMVKKARAGEAERVAVLEQRKRRLQEQDQQAQAQPQKQAGQKGQQQQQRGKKKRV